MKRCPECRRDYYDDSLAYCLDDGSVLVDGPATDEPVTAVMPPDAAGEDSTRLFGATERNVDSPSATISSKRSLIISGTLGVALITALGLGAYILYGRGASKQIESIAVMPFVNDSGNADVEYLSDGMTETLISTLSQLPNLAVKARSSVFRYKGKEIDVRTVGGELNVQALLTGHVAKRGEQLALNLELIDARTENVIWSEQYNHREADLVGLQTEIARDVSNKLKTKLSDTEKRKIEKAYTQNPEAYRLYLQGRYHANKFTDEEWKKALDYYDRSIGEDPSFPLPYVGVAEYYQWNSDGTLAPIEAQPKAEAFARKALDLDETLAEAHTQVGSVSFYRDWNWAEAEREFKRAIELKPNSADAHYGYGYPLVKYGRFEDGIREMSVATDLDPLNLTMNSDLAWGYFVAGKLDRSVEISKRTLTIDPDCALAHAYLGLAYEYQGKHKEAVAELERSRQLDEVPTTIGWLGYVLGRSGDPAGAKRIIDELKEMSNHRFVSPYAIALVYAGIGEKDQAFAYLEKALEIRADSMVSVGNDPLCDNLRGDPRFQELLNEVSRRSKSANQ